MNKMKSIAGALIAIGLVVYALIAFTPHANIPEPCRTFREKMRQQATSETSLAGVIAEALPEGTLDKAMDERYGGYSAERCVAASADMDKSTARQQKAEWQDLMRQAGNQATDTVLDCRNKRMSGELKTNTESVQCSNPQITEAYKKIGYPYMNLVGRFIDKRLELARKHDSETFPGSDEMDFARLTLEIAEAEHPDTTAPASLPSSPKPAK